MFPGCMGGCWGGGDWEPGGGDFLVDIEGQLVGAYYMSDSV